MSYLLIPRISIQAANAFAGHYAITPAQVMAINLFVHNLGIKTGCRPQGVAILHHDAQLLGEYGHDRFYEFQPQQRRGATFIDGKDYSSKNPHALSLQPSASCHLTLSLLIHLDGGFNQRRIEQFLSSARIAGGSLIQHGPLKSADDLDDLPLPQGYWIIERSDLLTREENPLDALINALGYHSPPDSAPKQTPPDEAKAPPPLPETWLAVAVLGYATITPFAQRAGVRLTDRNPLTGDAGGTRPLHAYGEPLLGLVQYVSRRQYNPRPIPFWHPTWLQDDVFVVRQTQAS